VFWGGGGYHGIILVANAVERTPPYVEEVLPGSDVVVHVEPRQRGLDLRERVLATCPVSGPGDPTTP